MTAGHALCVPGNHDAKFVRAARGQKVKQTHGLTQTLDQYALWEPLHGGSLAAGADFLDRLVSHYVLDDGRLVVAHAGLTQQLQGRSSGVVREFCVYGDVTGETDEEGYPVRRDWAVNYRGPAKVVYGHIVGWQDLRLAPFQLLATEGRTYFDRPHQWHLEQAAGWALYDSQGVIIPTGTGLEPNPEMD